MSENVGQLAVGKRVEVSLLALTQAMFEKSFARVVTKIGFENADGSVNWSKAPTGDRYVTMSTDGPKEEGERGSGYFADEAAAIGAWFAAARNWAEGRGSTLYWRHQPMVDVRLAHGRSRKEYTVYGRLWVGP